MPTTSAANTNLTLEPRGDVEIIMTRAFKAPAGLVFDAWTKPEYMKRWFGPSDWTVDVCEIDLRPGGKYRIHMKKTTDQDQVPTEFTATGDEMGLYGEYSEVSAPTLLVNTEFFDEPYFDVMGAGTVNRLDFKEADGVTTQVATTVYKSKEARDNALQTGMAEGVEHSFNRMEELLATLS